VLPALPAAPVGKIFQPALSMLEIEDVVRQESQSAGTALKSLTAGLDPKRGPLAGGLDQPHARNFGRGMAVDALKLERQEDQHIHIMNLILGGELEGKSTKRSELRFDLYTSPVLQ
jgi:hypothetical protein